MELKVGEYVRTKQGYIAKVTKQLTYSVYCFDSKVEYSLGIPEYRLQDTIFDKVIVKHSSNIIDLIEEEDIAVLNCYGFKVKKIVKQDDILELKLGNYELLEILTKEQFNQMKYIVGG